MATDLGHIIDALFIYSCDKGIIPHAMMEVLHIIAPKNGLFDGDLWEKGPNLSPFKAGLSAMRKDGIVPRRIEIHGKEISGDILARIIGIVFGSRLKSQCILNINSFGAQNLIEAFLPARFPFHLNMWVNEGPWNRQLALEVERLGRKMKAVSGTMALCVIQGQREVKASSGDAWLGWLEGHGWPANILGLGEYKWGVYDLEKKPSLFQMEKKRIMACRAPWSRPAISLDGIIYTCKNCQESPYRIGCFPDSSMLSSWAGDKILTIRKAHLEGSFWNMPYCMNCLGDGQIEKDDRLLSSVEGDTYRRRLEYGDILAPPHFEQVEKTKFLLEELLPQYEKYDMHRDKAQTLLWLGEHKLDEENVKYIGLEGIKERIASFDGEKNPLKCEENTKKLFYDAYYLAQKIEDPAIELKALKLLYSIGENKGIKARLSRLLREDNQISSGVFLWEIFPKDEEEAKEALISLKEAEFYQKLYDMAKTLLENDGNNPYYLEHLGYALFRLGDYQGAIEPLSISENRQGKLLLAICLRATGRFQSALKQAELLLEEEPLDPFLLKFYGDIAHEKGDYAQALEKYRLIQEDGIMPAEIFRMCALCNYHLENWDEAIAFAKAYPDDDYDGELALLIAQSHKGANRFEKALIIAREILIKHPDHQKARQISAFCRAGLRAPRKPKSLNSRLFEGIKWPAELQIGITDRCNISCLFCTQNRVNNPLISQNWSGGNWRRKDMDLEDFKRIIQVIKDERLRFDSIMLFWLGEPLLHPDFLEMVDILFQENKFQRIFKTLRINTNGQLMDDEMAQVLLKKALSGRGNMHITWSLDALSQDIAKKIKGFSGNIKLAGDSLKKMARSIKENKAEKRINITAQFLICQENYFEAPDFAQYWSSFFKEMGIGGTIITKDGHNSGFNIRFKPANQRDISNNILLFDYFCDYQSGILTRNQYMDLCQASINGEKTPLKKLDSSVLFSEKMPILLKNRPICGGPFKTPTIAPDGTLTTCCDDVDLKLAVGNVLKEGIKKLWNSEKIEKIREIHKDGEYARLPECCQCAGISPLQIEEIEILRPEWVEDYKKRRDSIENFSPEEILAQLEKEGDKDIRISGYRIGAFSQLGDLEAQICEYRTALSYLLFKCRKYQDSAQELMPFILDITNKLGALAKEAGFSFVELAVYRFLYRLQPTLQNLTRLAHSAKENNRFLLAKRAFEDILAIVPEDQEAKNSLDHLKNALALKDADSIKEEKPEEHIPIKEETLENGAETVGIKEETLENGAETVGIEEETLENGAETVGIEEETRIFQEEASFPLKARDILKMLKEGKKP